MSAMQASLTAAELGNQKSSLPRGLEERSKYTHNLQLNRSHKNVTENTKSHGNFLEGNNKKIVISTDKLTFFCCSINSSW